MNVRASAAALTTAAGYVVSDGGSGHGPNESKTVDAGMTIGFALGALTAVAFDALWLSREEAPKSTASPTITPGVAPTRSGVAAGLSGTF